LGSGCGNSVKNNSVTIATVLEPFGGGNGISIDGFIALLIYLSKALLTFSHYLIFFIFNIIW